ncbi:MAG: transporter [Pirellulaceae bacterium]
MFGINAFEPTFRCYVVFKLMLLFLLACTIADVTQAQSPRPTWHEGTFEEASLRRIPPIAVASGNSPADLSRLSNEELIDLYVAAQDESLRVLVADQSALVESGRFLVQLGYTFSLQDQERFRDTTHTVPELLLRYRLLERIEVRVAWAGVTLDGLSDRENDVTDWDTRLSDPSAGLRLALLQQRGWIPHTSLTISSPLNVESDMALANRLDPLVGMGYSWRLHDRWLLSGSSAVVWTREGDDRFLDFQQLLSLDWLVAEKWSLYAEWSGIFPEGARWDGMGHAIGPGLSYSLTRNTQLDWVSMFGLDDASPDVLTQLLLSWRF